MANGLGQQPFGQPTQLQQIGNSLQGFSAGLQGQLPQFQQAQNQKRALQQQQQQQQQEQQRLAAERNKEEEEARAKAVFTDAKAALTLLDSGDFDALKELGINRLTALKQLPGSDPSDTQRLMKLAVAAGNESIDPKRAKQAQSLLRDELKSIVRLGEVTGMIPGPEIVKGGDISKQGQVVTQEDGVFTATDIAGFKRPEDSSERARRENALAEQLKGSVPNPLDTARNIISGRIKLEANPQTGVMTMTDIVKAAKGDLQGAAIEIPLDTFDKPPLAPPQGKTLFELTDAATGLGSAIRAGTSRATAQFGAPVATETIEARQTIKLATNDLIRALSINPRFPVGEINRIKEETNIESGAFNSPGAMRADMRALDRSLRVRMDQAMEDANDQNLSASIRSDQRANASSIENFLVQLGVPREVSVADLDSVQAVVLHSPQELKTLIRSMDQKQFDNLSEEVKVALEERIK